MADRAVDPIDELLLDALERNGRMSMRQLADEAHISRANAYARVERLTKDGIVKGYTAVVDPVARGLTTAAYVTLSIQQAKWRYVCSQLRAVKGIEHIALVGGEFDVVLLVRAKDNADLRRLVLEDIQAIDGVINTRTLLVFDEPELPQA